MLWDTDKLPIIKHVLKLLYIRGLPFGRPVVRGRGSAKSGLTIYFLYRSKRKNRGQGGGGGSVFGRKSWTSFMEGPLPNTDSFYPKVVVVGQDTN